MILALTDTSIVTIATSISALFSAAVVAYFSWRSKHDPAQADTEQEQIVSTRQLWRDTVEDLRKLREKQEEYLAANGNLRSQITGLEARVQHLEAELAKKETALIEAEKKRQELDEHLHDMRNRAHTAELKVVSLKMEVNSLELAAGQQPRYPDPAGLLTTKPATEPNNP